jgi:hypothetical protein
MTPQRVQTLALAMALAAAPLSGAAQNVVKVDAAPVKQLTVQRIKAGTVKLDGRLDDTVWAKASFHSDFEQKGNDRSYPPRVRTEVAFVRDDEALYVAARMQNDVAGAPRRSVLRR